MFFISVNIRERSQPCFKKKKTMLTVGRKWQPPATTMQFYYKTIILDQNLFLHMIYFTWMLAIFKLIWLKWTAEFHYHTSHLLALPVTIAENVCEIVLKHQSQSSPSEFKAVFGPVGVQTCFWALLKGHKVTLIICSAGASGTNL